MDKRQKAKARRKLRKQKRCAYCGTTLTKQNRTIDHVIPKVIAGSKRGNFVFACRNCNNRKGDKLYLKEPPK